ncbi:MAG: Gfo/Idh/MocA family oxidoreductase [Pseudomonadota bacterium]
MRSQPPNSPIRIGLLGASRIARGAIIEPAQYIDGVEVTRIAASSAEKARRYASEHGIPVVEADYDALVSSDAVDLVYNALPPSGHCHWSQQALANGKHVLCEKPFAMNAVEARAMLAAAETSAGELIEAFHYRYHPLFEHVLATVASGRIGEIRSLKARFDVAIPYVEGELRHTLSVGGGALMDLGCYPVHWVRTIMGGEPTVVTANAVQERPGIDLEMRAALDFAGVTAEIACSMAIDKAFAAELRIVADRGSIVVTNPLAPHDGHSLVITVDGEMTSTSVDGQSTYWHQLTHVLDVIAGRATPVTGGADAVANMVAIDAIYRAAGMSPR